MSTVGALLLVAVTGLSFAAAFFLGLLPMNPWVRASLMSLGVTAILMAPLAVEPQSDIEGILWFGMALWALAGWIVGFPTGLLARFAFRRRSTTRRARTQIV